MGRKPAPRECSNTWCKRTHVTKFKTCDTCRANNRPRSIENSAEAAASGLCTTCRKYDADAGAALCVGCLADKRARNHKVRRAAKKNGLCGQCTKRPRQDGKKSCRRCRRKVRAAWLRRKRAEIWAMRKDTKMVILDVLKIRGELDLNDLAKDAKVSPRQVLRHMRRLVPEYLVEVDVDDGPGHRNIYRAGRAA